MRVLRLRTALATLFAASLITGASVGFCEEKTMSPLGGAGIPMIEGIKMVEVGSVAPDFTIKDLTGAPYTLSAQAGKKVVILVFWSIFCEPCREEMPILKKVGDKYKESGVDVVSVVLDGEQLKSSIEGFVKQEKINSTVLIDELDSKEMFMVADPYGVGGTPTLFIIDISGKVVFAKAGRLTEVELEKAVLAAIKK